VSAAVRQHDDPWGIPGAVALLALAGAAGLRAADALGSRSMEGEALACALGALLLAAAAFLFVRPPSAEWLGRCRRAGPAAAAVAAIGVAAVTLAVFAPDGWDECAYLLNGLALRGAPLPYADHRAPVTGALCALFAGAPSLMNPVLLLVLFSAVVYWASRQWDWTAAFVVGLLLLAQDLLLTATLDITSELPATVLLTLACLFLAAGRHATGGLFLGLLILARWNMAAFAAACFVAAWVAWGFRPALRIVIGAAAPVAIWVAAAAVLGHPSITAATGQFASARNAHFSWAPPTTVWDRVAFHVPNYFWLTPFGLLAVLWSPFLRSKNTHDDLFRTLIPAGVLATCAANLLVGGVLRRLFTPLLPVVLLVLCDVFLRVTDAWGHRQRLRAVIVVGACTVAWGLLPGGAVSILHNNLVYRPAFSQALVDAVAAHVPPREMLTLPPVPALAGRQPLLLMYNLRHVVDYPTARRNSVSSVMFDADEAYALEVFFRAVPSGQYVIVPGSGANAGALDVLRRDGPWVLARTRADGGSGRR